MVTILLALLVGCAPQPASIKLEGESVTVHTLDAVSAPKAEVLDASGAAIDPQPAVTWSVTPDTVAKLEGDKVVPVAAGEATLTATLGEIHSDYKIVVALPDKIEVTGYNAGETIPVGETRALVAAVKAGEAAVEGQTVTWASDNAAVATVDDKGTVTAVAEGTANVTVAAAGLSQTVAVTVGAAAPAAADAK